MGARTDDTFRRSRQQLRHTIYMRAHVRALAHIMQVCSPDSQLMRPEAAVNCGNVLCAWAELLERPPPTTTAAGRAAAPSTQQGLTTWPVGGSEAMAVEEPAGPSQSQPQVQPG